MSAAAPAELPGPPPLPPLRLAVVGHVEWVSFVMVERLPSAGQIQHALETLEQPAGGGAVVAAQFSRLTNQPVAFYTALGRDALGERAAAELRAMGLELHVAWRESPTRRAITFVEASGERTITVIGERLSPAASDPLPWAELAGCDGVFVTAADEAALRLARRARVLAATPRVRLPVLQAAAVELDALIGSARDPGEKFRDGDLFPAPRIYVATEAEQGDSLSLEVASERSSDATPRWMLTGLATALLPASQRAWRPAGSAQTPWRWPAAAAPLPLMAAAPMPPSGVCHSPSEPGWVPLQSPHSAFRWTRHSLALPTGRTCSGWRRSSASMEVLLRLPS